VTPNLIPVEVNDVNVDVDVDVDFNCVGGKLNNDEIEA